MSWHAFRTQGRRATDVVPASTERFATAVARGAANVPLRVRSELAERFLFSDHVTIDTADLIERAYARTKIYTSDRASALAVLRGLVG
jgi:hypothetical protein